MSLLVPSLKQGAYSRSTSEKKFVSSVRFNGNTSYVIPMSDIILGSDDFTVSVWFRAEALDWGRIFTFQRFVQDDGNSGWPTCPGFQARLTHTSGKIEVCLPIGTYDQFYSWAFPFTLNEWAHLAVTRKGSTAYCFYNGTLQGSQNIGTGAVWQDSTWYFAIGAGWGQSEADKDTVSNCLTGNIEDLLICKGTCLWTESFTPPSQWNASNLPNGTVLLFPGDSTPINSAISQTSWTTSSSNLIEDTDVTTLRSALDSLNTYRTKMNNCDCSPAGSYCQSCQTNTNQSCQSSTNQSCQGSTNQACQSSTNQSCQSTCSAQACESQCNLDGGLSCQSCQRPFNCNCDCGSSSH